MANVSKKFSQEPIATTQTNEPVLRSVKADVVHLEPELFRQMVAARAFYKAEQRGFEPGHELEDWLEAEQELLADPALLEKGKD
ncbi:MAG TPA: DUF2934 domain-containing protein [Methylococcaceae bacterium]|nr:DUF2934 domain-containing protein [Methylococcaceae bacterium]